jgi:hypothetical protein
MFNRDTPREIIIVSGGIMSCMLKLLSDQQAADLARAQKTIRHALADGGSRTEVASIEGEFKKVFDSVRVDVSGVEFDEFDATAALQKLQAVEAGELTRSGDLIVVPLTGEGFETTVFLRVPKQREMNKFSRSATSTISKPRQRLMETTVNLFASAELFDAIFQSSTGYVESSITAIPIGHKDAAVVAMLQYIDEQFADRPN